MSTGKISQRSNYLGFLQIAGAFSIVAFHIGIPFSEAGWIPVELFFVIAGINMFAACGREQSTAGYAWSRARRFFPELCAAWCVAVVFLLLGCGSTGMLWFIGTAPFFLQNLALPFFSLSMPRDWVFTSLWFIAALLQLQVLLVASKRFWMRARPVSLIVAAFSLGVSFRLLFAWMFGENPGALSYVAADALYCLPFSHVESIVLGLMIGRGALSGIGRLFPAVGALVLLLGALNLWLSGGLLGVHSGGYEFPLRLNYSHVWGYSILAFAAASLCANDGPVAIVVERAKRLRWLRQGVSRLAPLTCGVYLFHGIIMATGVNGAHWLSREHAPGLRLLLFGITMFESFLVAWAFTWFIRVAIPKVRKTRFKRMPDFGEIRDRGRSGGNRTLPLVR